MISKMKERGNNAVRLNYRFIHFQDPKNLANFERVMKAFADNGIFIMPVDHNYLSDRMLSYPTFKKIMLSWIPTDKYTKTIFGRRFHNNIGK